MRITNATTIAPLRDRPYVRSAGKEAEAGVNNGGMAACLRTMNQHVLALTSVRFDERISNVKVGHYVVFFGI